MRRLAIVFGFVVLTIQLCAAPVLPIKVSSNGRYFTDQNNVPWILMTDAAHHIMPAIPTSSWTSFLSSLVSNGFNSVDIYGLCYATSGTCTSNAAAYDGTLPFTSGTSPSNYDLSTPNSSYWSEVDTLVADAAADGLVVFFDPAPWGQGFSIMLPNNGATKAFNYGVFLGNRYKADTNIIWYVGEDFDGSSAPSSTNLNLEAQVAAGIQSVDSNHIITTQLYYNESYTTQESGINSAYDAASLYNFVYDYYAQYDYGYAAYNNADIPVIMGEANYETANNTGGLSAAANAFITRLQSWYVMTSGGTGFEFGNEHVNHFDSGYSSTSGPCSPQSCLSTTATIQQQYIPQLFGQYQWQTFAPDQTNQVVTAGYGTYNGTSLNLYAATYATTTWDGSGNAIIYAPVSTTLTVNMAKFSAPVNAYWYDPTAGTSALISGSPFTNSGSHNFTSPAAHTDTYDDWVLVLAATSSAPISSQASGVKFAGVTIR